MPEAKAQLPENSLQYGLTPEDLKALTNYPSLGKLFEEKDLQRLTEMKSKLSSTLQGLERVIRHGSSAEAEKAQCAAQAVTVSINFLETLEQMAQNQM
jgi:hypothetical protein